MKTITEQLVLKSTDGLCSICRKLENDPRDPFRMELAHIVPESHGGKKTFWNLLPTCPFHNAKTRENKNTDDRKHIEKYILFDKIEEAHNYWTYLNSRTDVAIKVCLYKIYEYLALGDNSVYDNIIRDADILLYHVLWNCRTYLYFKVQKKIFKLKKMIEQFVNGEVKIQYSNLFEEAIYLHDEGNYKPLVNIVLSDKYSEEIQKKSRTVIWRIIQYPNIPLKIINKLSEYNPTYPENHKYYQYEKDFDFKLRTITSLFIKYLFCEDKKGIREVTDQLVKHKEDIRKGIGCSHTYQRLYPFLKAVYLDLRGNEVEDLLKYVEIHGSKAPIRKISIPKEILNNKICNKKYVTNKNSIDIGNIFIPITASYGSDLNYRRKWVKEEDLVEILDKIIDGFSKTIKIKK